jgi:anti-sigma factor (TIGR02949 family)
VTHPAFEAQLDAYLDGELAPPDAAELEAHLRACPDCSRLERRRRALSAAVRKHVLRFPAPDTLRARVRTALRADLNRTAQHRSYWPGLAVAASLAVVAVGSWQAALRRATGDALADQVLGSHVRSLMPGHLIDVQSSDQHTVKPWFNGKLDFSPPVYDFAGRGFPLIGGRLEYVGGRPVAALVYGRRQHVINVFLWPAERGPTGGRPATTRQGYHLLHWTTPAYTYWVASDLGLPELRDFAALLERGDSVAAPL